MVTNEVHDTVRSYLNALQEEDFNVSFGVLFGSQADGAPRPDSDIDLVVVSPRFDTPHNHSDRDRLWQTAARTDSRIEPIACGTIQWAEDSASAILDTAKRDGVRILP